MIVNSDVKMNICNLLCKIIPCTQYNVQGVLCRLTISCHQRTILYHSTKRVLMVTFIIIIPYHTHMYTQAWLIETNLHNYVSFHFPHKVQFISRSLKKLDLTEFYFHSQHSHCYNAWQTLHSSGLSYYLCNNAIICTSL